MTASVPLRRHSLRAMVLWESGCLARNNSPYPLKPHRTATLVNLGEGTFDPPRSGRNVSGQWPARLLARRPKPMRVDHPRNRTSLTLARASAGRGGPRPALAYGDSIPGVLKSLTSASAFRWVRPGGGIKPTAAPRRWQVELHELGGSYPRLAARLGMGRGCDNNGCAGGSWRGLPLLTDEA